MRKTARLTQIVGMVTMKTNAAVAILCMWVSIALSTGCAHGTDYLVHFRSQTSFRPRDGSELIAELQKSLPPEIVIQHFFFNHRKEEMRGSVMVAGRRGKGAVLEALRTNPRLRPVITEKAHSGGKSLICFSSSETFKPSDEAQLLKEFKSNLPSVIEPDVLMTRRKGDRIVSWVLVQGNLGRAAAKFAVRQNPNLSLLQVEDWSFPLRFGFWRRMRRSSPESRTD